MTSNACGVSMLGYKFSVPLFPSALSYAMALEILVDRSVITLSLTLF